jgi:hypothetical protein
VGQSNPRAIKVRISDEISDIDNLMKELDGSRGSVNNDLGKMDFGIPQNRLILDLKVNITLFIFDQSISNPLFIKCKGITFYYTYNNYGIFYLRNNCKNEK